MKIHQLPMGARFEFEGKAYVKAGPQIGSGEGGQRLIPKYAVLKVLDGSAPAPATKKDILTREAVVAAFEQYHAACETMVPQEQRAGLDAARKAFFEAIG